MNVSLTGECQMELTAYSGVQGPGECSLQNGCGTNVKVWVKMHTHGGWDRRALRWLSHLCFLSGLTGEGWASNKKGILSLDDEHSHRQLAITVRDNCPRTHLPWAPDSVGALCGVGTQPKPRVL